MPRFTCQSNVFSIQFLCDDYIIEDNSQGLHPRYNNFWDMGDTVTDFLVGKELLKSRVLECIGTQDLQEVWPEILEKLQQLQNISGVWRVWSGGGRIGLAVKAKK